MTYGLIGEKLGHSFSKLIHERLTGIPYELLELQPDRLGEFLQKGEFRGINVTIPYKQAVIPYLDSLAPSAELTGAVNVIVRSADGRLTGHNTDLDGVLAMAAHAGVSFSGASVVIIGAGGASKAVAAAARSAGARKLVFAVRHDFGPERLPVGNPEAFADCEVLINATPVGMYPGDDGKPLDISALPNLRGVLDCVYNPIRTELVLDALERGIAAEGGLMMLVAQAVRASELFLDRSYEPGVADDLYRWLLRGRRNIVLCGMPSCGKSTVGQALAGRLGMQFADTDDLIRSDSGMEIPDIFAREGEAGFRKRERSAIQSLASGHGMVVATGGGAVLDPSNVRALRRNGLIVFLDRPPELLQPTDDRPLSRDRAALERLYAQRLPAYIAAADARIPNDGPLSDTLESIISHALQG
ncbi:MAG: hypothetical protein IK031_03630 [Bacteroidales bacterium]|nr:hypothetical protein [Bacteroidales bacterium]